MGELTEEVNMKDQLAATYIFAIVSQLVIR